MVLLALVVHYFCRERMESQKMSADNDVVQFELQNGLIDVDSTVMEDIKRAMLLFFNKPEEEFPAKYLESKDFLKEDIESSATMMFLE